MIQKKIKDPRSSDHVADESFPRLDSLVPLMHHDLSDLGSMIQIFRLGNTMSAPILVPEPSAITAKLLPTSFASQRPIVTVDNV